MRITKGINYGWKYVKDFKDEYINTDFNDGEYEFVNIPHSNIQMPYNNFNESMYSFVSCYKKSVKISSDYKEKHIFICFQGVAHSCKVYINRCFAGEHKGGYTPFEIKINKFINYDKENEITVVVDSMEEQDIPPFGNVIDYLTYGGIYREVSLKILDESHIRDIFVKTTNVLKDKKLLEVEVELSDFYKSVDVECVLIDVNNITIESFTEINVTANKIKLTKEVEGVELWDINNPKLYKLRTRLIRYGTIFDEVTTRFGFREAVFKSNGFYLNGEKIKLRGLNRHQSFANVGYAMPKSLQEKDAEILKNELGVNIVRTSHYPQSVHFLNKCDELGLLVFTEIPGWQHIGDSEQWRNIVLQNVEEMIVRDRNHPSVILWGVRINESVDCDELYKKTNQLAHKLDDTRQTGGVRNFGGSKLLEDVYTYNDFVHSGKNKPLELAEKITKVNNVPYLVTEHNGHMYPTKSFDNEKKRLEHSLRHMRVLNEMYGSKGISGAIGWCMFDYNTHGDFGSGDKICYHGVMDMFRIPKIASYVYSSQQDKYPVMEVASTFDIGEHEAGELGDIYVFTNCEYVKLYINDEEIKTFYPDKTIFKNLPHPPIIIDDLIGNRLENGEEFSKKDAKSIKEVLLAFQKYGADNLPLKYKLKMALVMAKTKMSFNDGVDLYGKYIGNWGRKRTELKFEGYIGDELVKTVIKESVTKPKLQVYADASKLVEEDTYDATRIVVKAVCQNNNVLPYANDVIKIETEGPIEVIGEDTVALIGGVRGIYIKTMGKVGFAKVTIKSANLGEETLVFNISKKKV